MSEQKTAFENHIKSLPEFDEILLSKNYDGSYVFRDIRNGWIYWQASIAEANKRIEALEGEVAELKAELKSEKEHSNILLKNGGEFYRNELALKAHINTLREALDMLIITKEYKDKQGKDAVYETMRTNAWKVAENALSATPAQSLQSVINETIEKCAKVADAWENISCKDKIRALKEVK